ncbi:MAG: radical SAM protein, partial [Planctomycetota bacterium]
GIADLSMTTNGFALAEHARSLRDAGLDRVTVSMDSLEPEKFRRITRTGDLTMVRRGIDAALDVGLGLKINVVAMRGVNDVEFADFADLTRTLPITVRFIEYMPLGESAFYEDASDDEVGPAGGCGAPRMSGDVFINEADIRARIGTLVECEPDVGVGPAVVWQVPGGVGRVGFISAMSAPFCSTCNRLRLTATGILRSCLFDGGEVDLKPHLRADTVADAMVQCVALKPDTHSAHGNQQMSRIGG